MYAAKGVLSTDQVVAGVMSVETLKGLFLALWFFFLWWAESEYRTFEWYRFRKTQAKTGFVTGAFVFGFGMINLIADLLVKRPAGWYVYLSMVVAGVLVVYIRSGRKLEKDWGLLRKRIKGLSIKDKSKWLKKLRRK